MLQAKWKKIITESEKIKTWVNIEQPRLIIKGEKDDAKKEVFSIYLKSEEGLSQKLLAKCGNLKTAMKWVEELGTEKIIKVATR